MVKRRREVLHRRESRILHDYGRVELSPGMIVEVAADHLAELRPFEEGVVAGVRADKALAFVLHERDQVLLLLGGQIVARAEVEDRVEVIQVPRIAGRRGNRLLRDPLRIRADVHFVRARVVAQPFHGGQGVRDRIVLEGGQRVSPRQHALWPRPSAESAKQAGSRARRPEGPRPAANRQSGHKSYDNAIAGSSASHYAGSRLAMKLNTAPASLSPSPPARCSSSPLPRSSKSRSPATWASPTHRFCPASNGTCTIRTARIRRS